MTVWTPRQGQERAMERAVAAHRKRMSEVRDLLGEGRDDEVFALRRDPAFSDYHEAIDEVLRNAAQEAAAEDPPYTDGEWDMDPESQEDLALHDALHPNGYRS